MKHDFCKAFKSKKTFKKKNPNILSHSVICTINELKNECRRKNNNLYYFFKSSKDYS